MDADLERLSSYRDPRDSKQPLPNLSGCGCGCFVFVFFPLCYKFWEWAGVIG